MLDAQQLENLRKNPYRFSAQNFVNLCQTVHESPGSKEDAGRFDKWEVKSARPIYEEMGIYPGQNFAAGHALHNDRTKVNYALIVPAKVALNHPRVLPHVIAHEFKHHSITHSDRIGHVNVRTLRTILHKSSLKLLESEKKRREKLENNKTPGFLDTVKSTANLATRIVLFATNCRLCRFEERKCDDFAIRAHPNVDLNDVQTFHHDMDMCVSFTPREELEKRRPPEDVDPRIVLPEGYNNSLVRRFVYNFCHSHPSDEERLGNMRKKQREILKNG